MALDLLAPLIHQPRARPVIGRSPVMICLTGALSDSKVNLIADYDSIPGQTPILTLCRDQTTGPFESTYVIQEFTAQSKAADHAHGLARSKEARGPAPR